MEILLAFAGVLILAFGLIFGALAVANHRRVLPGQMFDPSGMGAVAAQTRPRRHRTPTLRNDPAAWFRASSMADWIAARADRWQARTEATPVSEFRGFRLAGVA